MFCVKCGSEMVNGRCERCGYVADTQPVNPYSQPTNSYGQSMMNNYSNEPKDANLIKLLGILSFFVPILAIVVLVMAKDYNKENNFGGSSDIKTGKLCAKISLGITIASIGFIILLYAFIFAVALLGAGLESTDPIYTDSIYMAIRPYIV